MNILYYTAYAGGFVNSWQPHHIVDELQRAGHRVSFLNPVETLGRTGSAAEYSQVLLDEARKMHAGSGIDFFFAVAQDALLLPSAVLEIRKMGIPAVHLSCDDLSHPFRIEQIASSFDINWSTVRESRARIESYGATVKVMPWGANPHVFKPVETPEDRVISFIGSPYGARGNHIAVMAEAGLPVRVYGKSTAELYQTVAKINHPIVRALSNSRETWQRTVKGLSFPEGRRILAAILLRSLKETFVKPPEKRLPDNAVEYKPSPSFDELGAALNTTALSLGSIELSSTYLFRDPLLFIRLREFEVPMCGGVHLVNRFPELCEYFEEDKEMLFYGSQEELIDKARFYLAPERDAARRAIRQQARKRAVAEHTWLHRFRAIGADLGLKF